MTETTCTCGETPNSRHFDRSGMCGSGSHDACQAAGGTLMSATGSHWWCVCECHREPTVLAAWAASARFDREAVRKALSTWRAARRNGALDE